MSTPKTVTGIIYGVRVGSSLPGEVSAAVRYT